jgi:hypothetical protein
MTLPRESIPNMRREFRAQPAQRSLSHEEIPLHRAADHRHS